jgi:hypothetical protein
MVQMVSCTSRYYPKGIPKVAYVRWSHVHLLVRFAGRTSSGSPIVTPPKLASTNPVESLAIHPVEPTCGQIGNRPYKN